MRWVLSFGAPYFVGLRYCRGEQRKARGRGRCDGAGECAVLQWVPGGRKRVLACLSETGCRGQLWLGLPLARQKVLLRDGEGSAVRWLVQRAAFVERPPRQVPLCAVSRKKGCRGVVQPACRPCRASQASLPVASSRIVLCAMVFSPPCGGFLVRKPHFAFHIALLCARFAARKRKLLYLCDRMRTHVHTHTQ